MAQESRRKLLKVAVRVLITAAFLAVLAFQADWGRLWERVRGADLRGAAAFLPLMVLTILEMGLRWGLVMRASGIPARFGGAIAVGYVGAFFNQFSIGAAGGDIARAILAARDTELKARAVGTILIDRAVGLGTLILMGFATAAANFQDPMFRPFAVGLGGLMAAMAMGALVYFNPALRRSRAGRWLKERLPWAGTVREMDEAFGRVVRRPGLLAFCVLITAVGQAAMITAIWGLARSLGLAQVTPAQCFALMPPIFVVMALPISIGGLGVGEAAFVQAFVRTGVRAEDALSLAVLYRLANFAVSLPGIVIFLVGKGRTR
jgi:uncharacterized membrane protein YbhN (UPF0104 family)